MYKQNFLKKLTYVWLIYSSNSWIPVLIFIFLIMFFYQRLDKNYFCIFRICVITIYVFLFYLFTKVDIVLT